MIIVDVFVCLVFKELSLEVTLISRATLLIYQIEFRLSTSFFIFILVELSVTTA